MKKTRMLRAPVEFHSLLTKWSKDAKKKGYDYGLTEIQRVMAYNMKDVTFRPDIKVFKRPDLYDVVYPVRRRKK